MLTLVEWRYTMFLSYMLTLKVLKNYGLHQLWLQNGPLLQQLELSKNHFFCSDILIFSQITFKVNTNLHLHFASAWCWTCKGNNWNDWESCMTWQSLLQMTFYYLENDYYHNHMRQYTWYSRQKPTSVVTPSPIGSVLSGYFYWYNFSKILLQRNKLTITHRYETSWHSTVLHIPTPVTQKLFCRYNVL
jgi:hypothetical protein